MVSRRQVVPMVTALLIVLCGLSLGRVYNGGLLALLVAGAAVGSVAVSAPARRAPAFVVAPVSVAALAGYALLAVWVSGRSGGVPGDVWTLTADAARNALPRLVTALIPVEAQPDTVLAPVVLAWLAGFAGTELAARSRRPAVALIPPTLLYAGALVLVGPNAEPVAWQTLAFAALAAVALVAGNATSGARSVPGIGRQERTALRLRTATGLAAGLVAVLAVVALTTPLVGDAVTRRPVDPRQYVQPPTLDVLDQNPLIRISGWAANPGQRLFDLTVVQGGSSPAPPSATPTAPASLPPGVVAAPTDDPDPAVVPETVDPAAYDTRLRLAVLSDWDGVTWHVNADYRNAGRVLPPVIAAPGRQPEEPMPTRTISGHITVAELQGRLLPAVAAPHEVGGLRVAYDRSSGTLLGGTPLTSGTSYTVTSINPGVNLGLLPAADVPSGPSVARYLAVGIAVPPDLTRLAETVSTGESSPYLRAIALQSFLAEHYRYAGDAPSGHSYPNLRFFLLDDPRAGGQRGTSEQFAAAYAALGRLMGLPTRVVVGFRTPVGGGPVTGADAIAWPEVLFNEVGWVAFNPMPEADTAPRPLEEQYLPKPPPPTSPPASLDPPAVPSLTASASSGAGAGGVAGGPGAGIIVGSVGGGLILLLIALLALVMLLRLRRRRDRLDRGTPPQRVLGAWAEVLDALVLAGAPAQAHLTAGEVAQHASRLANSAPGRHSRRPRPAVPPLADLADRVNAVGFAGQTVGIADEQAAADAKARAVGYALALRARRPWWRRLLWTVDPRPLRARSPRARRPD